MYILVDASFESSIIEQFRKQYQNAIMVADAKNKNVERQAEEMRMSILGKDSKTKELKPLDVVDAYVQVFKPIDNQLTKLEIRK